MRETAILGWRVFFTRRGLPQPRATDPFLATLRSLDPWLADHKVADGSPFLIDPTGWYDTNLNRYFHVQMSAEPLNTQVAAAYDLKRFLAFLWDNRAGKTWREATPEDRAAYKQWRLKDSRGPRVELVTWDREVATVNKFYRWAVRQGHVAANPIIQRESRSREPGRQDSGETPAESSHQGPRHDVRWMPPATYRQWRDVGVRGFTVAGLPNGSFRGRYASRNATFTDFMVRTGLRLSEQASLSVYEVPEMVPGVLNVRTWLPHVIAKGNSERAIYVPASVLKDVRDYLELERADAVEQARKRGVYERIRDPLLIEDRSRPFVLIDGERQKIGKLNPAERLRVLIRTDDGGLEPAALWLNEYGMPSDRSCWQDVFKAANRRCARLGLRLRCHPHMLRHSYAVITLEQLWRGHIQELAAMTPIQRQTYQMVFGDPLNWVRMRLGHSSIQTTQIYLHTLKELEMETRMALVPDGWEPTGVHPVDLDEPQEPDDEEAALGR
jgi:site-specific recombinase XerD